MNFGPINTDQWIMIISILTFLFGSGLFWRLFVHRGVTKEKVSNKKGDTKDVLPILIKENPYLDKVKIKVGDYKEFEWGHRLVKISVVDIVKENFETIVGNKTETSGAELKVDTGGGLVYGGKLTLPRLLYHYILEYPALIDSASTGMPVEKFSVSCLINSSGVRFPSELCGLAVL